MMTTDTLTATEAAQRLGVSTRYVWKLARQGRLVYAPSAGRGVRLTCASVDAYAAERKRGRPIKQTQEASNGEV